MKTISETRTAQLPSTVTLRAPEPTDVDILYVWENDPSAWHTSFATGPLSRHQIKEYVENYEADIFSQGSLRFVIEADGASVGAIDVFDFEPRARHAFVGIYVCPAWRGRGVGQAALSLLVDQLTCRVGISSLAAIVAVDNSASQSLFASAGFAEAGRLAGWIMRGKERVDGVIYQWTGDDVKPSGGK